MSKQLILAFTLLFVFAQVGFCANYKIDPQHSQLEFTVAHLMFFKVSGFFTDFTGNIVADPESKTLSSASASIQTTSIDTRIEKRDNHLHSADFFDVTNYPEMRFISTRVEGKGENLTVHGDLTIRGTTKPITLTGAFLGTAKDAWGNMRAGFAAKGKINRKDFGLVWNKLLETGGVTVGDEVEISLQIQGIKGQGD